MALPDYYALLEVPRTATAAEIKRSYRRLARRYHPDARGDQVSAADEAALNRRITLLNEAYAVLNNPQKRAAYDAQRRRSEDRHTMDNIAPPPSEPKMTWVEGIFGFVRELRKGLRGDS